MSIRFSPAAPAFLACALAAPLAHADDVGDNPRTLDTLVVTAAAPDSPLTWVTDPRLPRQPVPASDGADYLKTVPGFAAFRNGGTNGDPVLRGMFGSRLNVLSNDGSLIGACPARMDNPLSYISPETYDRLVLIKGPQSVRWGPGASAGTVRFERDTPHFDKPTLELSASALAGSFERNDQVLDATAGSALRLRPPQRQPLRIRRLPRRQRRSSALALAQVEHRCRHRLDPDADSVLEVSAGTGDALGPLRRPQHGWRRLPPPQLCRALRAQEPVRSLGQRAGQRLLQRRRPRHGQLQPAHAQPDVVDADADGGQCRSPHHRRPPLRWIGVGSRSR